MGVRRCRGARGLRRRVGSRSARSRPCPSPPTQGASQGRCGQSSIRLQGHLETYLALAREGHHDGDDVPQSRADSTPEPQRHGTVEPWSASRRALLLCPGCKPIPIRNGPPVLVALQMAAFGRRVLTSSAIRSRFRCSSRRHHARDLAPTDRRINPACDWAASGESATADSRGSVCSPKAGFGRIRLFPRRAACGLNCELTQPAVQRSPRRPASMRTALSKSSDYRWAWLHGGACMLLSQ